MTGSQTRKRLPFELTFIIRNKQLHVNFDFEGKQAFIDSKSISLKRKVTLTMNFQAKPINLRSLQWIQKNWKIKSLKNRSNNELFWILIALLSRQTLIIFSFFSHWKRFECELKDETKNYTHNVYIHSILINNNHFEWIKICEFAINIHYDDFDLCLDLIEYWNKWNFDQCQTDTCQSNVKILFQSKFTTTCMRLRIRVDYVCLCLYL